VVDAACGVEQPAQFCGGMVVLGCGGLRGREECGDRLTEDSFEEPCIRWAQRAGCPAADESLKVSQAEGARFVMLAGEGFSVCRELLEGQASFPDALFEQRAEGLIRQPAPLPCGEPVVVAGEWRVLVVPADTTLAKRLFQLAGRRRAESSGAALRP